MVNNCQKVLTRFLVQHLDGVVEVEVPEVPLAAGEAQLPTSHLHVGLGPVPGVGAHGPPASKFMDLEQQFVCFAAALDGGTEVNRWSGNLLTWV